MFPFAKRGEYFLLYGRRGLAEYQALVPHAAAADFLRALEREALRARPPVVMASLKLFRGERKLLRFEADGVCVTLDLVRSAEGLRFLEVLDRLTLEPGRCPTSSRTRGCRRRSWPGAIPATRSSASAGARSIPRALPLRALGEARAVTAVVVGASAGLGRALAEALAAAGHDLVSSPPTRATSTRSPPTCGSATG